MRHYISTEGISVVLLACCLGLSLGTGASAATGPAEPARGHTESAEPARESGEQVMEPDEPAEQAGERVSANLPEEIVVTGHDRLKLRELVSQAEDQVYALFNELNDDDLLDIHCGQEAITGRLIKQKVCRPNYLREAERGQGLYFMDQVQGNITGVPIPSAAVVEHYNPKLQEKMRQLMAEDEDFFDAVVEHARLQRVLEESRGIYEDE